MSQCRQRDACRFEFRLETLQALPPLSIRSDRYFNYEDAGLARGSFGTKTAQEPVSVALLAHFFGTPRSGKILGQAPPIERIIIFDDQIWMFILVKAA